jgi:RNA-directed DNA polymerase
VVVTAYVKGLCGGRPVVLNNDNNGINCHNNLNNNGGSVGIGKLLKLGHPFIIMSDQYEQICDYDNLFSAYEKARKGKTQKDYVIEFEANLKNNLLQLRNELLLHAYKPRPLTTFILRDPKTRKISKSDFRDRVIHHAVCNSIEPVFDRTFIHDSYANRIGKGTLNAVKRFNYFKKKVSKNDTRPCYVLKADVRKYFDSVDHTILLSILKNRINDTRVLWLIEVILKNHQTKEKGKGMPLGNLTSQFLANVYLNELDQFVKHELKARYYIRYVDDFVILNATKSVLVDYKEKIDKFLKEKLVLVLHPDKSRIITVRNGIGFLGFRIFCHHKLIRKKNLWKFERKCKRHQKLYNKGLIDRDKIVAWFEGWLAYIAHANTYKYRRHITRIFNNYFPILPKTEITQLKKHENLVKKQEASNVQFSSQKTLQLFKKGLTVQQIAAKRGIKEGTVWEHLSMLIEYNQISLNKILSKEKRQQIFRAIKTDDDKLKEIKTRINDPAITYNEIQCCLASIRARNRTKYVSYHVRWYKHVHCYRKCYFDKNQRKACTEKFKKFQSVNPGLEMKRKEFVELFNNHMTICVLPEKEKQQFISWKQFVEKIRKPKMIICKAK